MKKIINFHMVDSNIGDRYSSPLRYFKFATEVEERNILDFSPEDDISDCNIIIGGGGLLYGNFNKIIGSILESRRGKAVLWGAGFQVYGSKFEADQQFRYPDYMGSFDLAGIRDFDQGYEWVPCPSCMHEGFDRKIEIKHDFVVY